MITTAAENVDDEPQEFIRSLARGLSVIRVFSADHSAMTLSEVADSTGLSRAAAIESHLVVTRR